MSLPSLPFLAKTKVSWTGEQDEDLGFLENEIVKVFNIVDELWWQGSLSRNGAEGIFPREFVTVIPSSNTGSAQPTPTKAKAALVPNLVTLSSLKNLGRRSNPVTPLKADYRGHERSGTYDSAGRNIVTLRLSPAIDEYNQSFDDTFDRSFQRTLRSKQKQPYLYSQHVLGLGLSKLPGSEDRIHTQTKRLSKLMSPEASPIRTRAVESAPPKTARDADEFYQTISQKKQELEMQLHHLRQLEKSHLQQKIPTLCDSSFLSEDILLSRHNGLSKDGSGRSMEQTVYTISDDEDGPPPPPKHKAIPFDADEFRASGATLEVLMKSYSQYPEELKNSMKSLQSDVLNLSELSATSAGSFMRHKYEKDLQASRGEPAYGNENLIPSANDEDQELINSIFKNKKNRQSNLFKKLIKKKPEQNAMEARLEGDSDNWQKVKADLNRTNTLSSLDKQIRTKRVVRNEPNFIVKPLEYISDINTSETFGAEEIGDFRIETNNRKVDEFLSHYDTSTDLNDLISDISVKFGSSRPDQVRAVLLHLCKFKIIEEGESILRLKPKLREVMTKREATVYQLNYLFKKLLEALHIPSEVVLGFWKKPNEFYHSDQFLINHCWLSVMLESPENRGNGTFRMIDLLSFQRGLICNIEGQNEFYFLAKPLSIVSSHIPSVVELQHVFPPIDLNVAFHLPRMYSSFQKNNLEFINFNNALTRMNDLEIFEADILVPPTVELFTLIKASTTTSNDYTLCQIYWKNSQRIAKVKAILPAKESIGVLQIFAGPKGLQTHFDNIHELACVIPLYHSGQSRECTFVPRYPTIQSQNNDLYIRHPQTSTIAIKNSYNFEIEAHPSMGLRNLPSNMNSNFKLVIESPSGKYTKLISDNSNLGHETYHANILCQEPGVYRGLVIGDSGNSWYVFGQWECCSA